MEYSFIDETEFLTHYGILGMKWGRRPSDPNPNDASHHPVKSTQSNRGETAQSNSNSEESKGFHLTDKQKRYLKYGAIALGTGLAIYGGYQLYKAYGSGVPRIYDPESGFLKKSAEMLAKTTSESDCREVNDRRLALPVTGGGELPISKLYHNNCSKCSVAYDLRQRGYNVKAGPGLGEPVGIWTKWYDNPDITWIKPSVYPSGLKFTDDPAKLARETEMFFADPWVNISKAFTNGEDGINQLNRINEYTNMRKEAASKLASQYPLIFREHVDRQNADVIKACEKHGPGARGTIITHWASAGGHSLQWENDSNGKVRLVESQLGRTGDVKRLIDDELSHCDPYQGVSVIRLDNAKPNMKVLKEQHVIENPGDDLDRIATGTSIVSGLIVANALTKEDKSAEETIQPNNTQVESKNGIKKRYE